MVRVLSSFTPLIVWAGRTPPFGTKPMLADPVYLSQPTPAPTLKTAR